MSAAPRWQSYHVFLPDTGSSADRLLKSVGASDLCERLRRTGRPWFFVRYWAGGPHVRLRLQAARRTSLEVARRLTELAPSTADAGADPLEHYRRYGPDPEKLMSEFGWFEPGSVAAIDYEPEFDRYGGAAVMDASERLFHVSSEIAMRVLGGDAAARRTSIALELMVATAAAVWDDPREWVDWLTRYVGFWQFRSGELHGLDTLPLCRAAEGEYLAAEKRYGAVRERLLAQRQAETGIAAVWRDAVSAFVREYRERSGTAPLWAVLQSHVHMTNNRLGVSIPEECYAATLAALILRGTRGSDYFRAGIDAEDLRYIEASKYFAAVMPAQKPLEGPLERAEHDPPIPPGAIVLPPPRPFRQTLQSALRRRRSGYGAYSGSVSLAEAADLIGSAAGVTTSGEFDITGIGSGRYHFRAYPSGGHRYPVRLLMYAHRVDGLTQGLYLYQPVGHCLLPLPGRRSVVALLECSPMLDPRENIAIFASEAPMWLILVGRGSAQRPKYGQRAYRLTLLEAGHLAQNILLTATALGLKSIPMGAFYDDALLRWLGLDRHDDWPAYLIPVGRESGAGSQATPASRGSASPAA